MTGCPRPVALEDHDRLRLELMNAGRALRDAVDDPGRFATTRDALIRFSRDRLLPHLDRDERWLAHAEQCPGTRLLAEAMRAESRQITAAVLDLVAGGPCEAVAAARVVHVLLAAHSQHADRLRAALSGAPNRRPDPA